MIDRLKHNWNVSSRREFFTQAGSGLAGMALASMLAETAHAAPALDPLLPKKPHHEPIAKSVIFLFMEGGPSHVDTYDMKPEAPVECRGIWKPIRTTLSCLSCLSWP